MVTLILYRDPHFTITKTAKRFTIHKSHDYLLTQGAITLKTSSQNRCNYARLHNQRGHSSPHFPPARTGSGVGRWGWRKGCGWGWGSGARGRGCRREGEVKGVKRSGNLSCVTLSKTNNVQHLVTRCSLILTYFIELHLFLFFEIV